MKNFLSLALLLPVAMVSATENRMCAEVCWTHHISDPNCESACLKHPSYSPQSTAAAEQCIANCLTQNSGGADLIAFARCRTKCFDQYFGEFLRTYSPHSKRSAVATLSDFYSPRAVCEDSDEFGRVSRQCYEDCWEKYPMHPQSGFINRVGCERGCSARIRYSPPRLSTRDAISPDSISRDSPYDDYESSNDDDDHSMYGLDSLDLQEHICKALCSDEADAECLPNCFPSLDPHAEEFQILFRCALLCLRGDVLIGEANIDLVICIRSCILEKYSCSDACSCERVGTVNQGEGCPLYIPFHRYTSSRSIPMKYLWVKHVTHITTSVLPSLITSEIPSGMVSVLQETISLPFNETNSTRAVAQYAMNQPTSAGSKYVIYRYYMWIPPVILSVALSSFGEIMLGNSGWLLGIICDLPLVGFKRFLSSLVSKIVREPVFISES